ncbi:MAG: hypothetical protein ABF586_12950 [Sporolactobacillus sp.]
MYRKKALALWLMALLVVFSLAGCSLSHAGNKGIAVDKMTADEHTAYSLAKGLYSGEQQKQLEAVKEYCTPNLIKTLSQKIRLGKMTHRLHGVKVIVSVNKKDSKGAYTLVLVHLENHADQAKQRILLLREGKVSKIHSPKNKHYKKEDKAIKKQMRQATS